MKTSAPAQAGSGRAGLGWRSAVRGAILPLMQVTIPEAFERHARERIAAGAVATVEEAVAIVLNDYMRKVERLEAEIEKGLNSGPAEPFDKERLMREITADEEAERVSA